MILMMMMRAGSGRVRKERRKELLARPLLLTVTMTPLSAFFSRERAR